MANFDIAAEIVLDHEGEYNSIKEDRGNYVCSDLGWVKVTSYPFSCKDRSTPRFVGTMRGIAAPNLAKWLGRMPTASEMRALTENTARQIYKAWFWDNILADRINSQELANLFFDAKVNQTGYSVYEMQRACNDLGSILVVDGVVGSKTIAAINSHDYRKLHDQYKERRRLKYYEQVEKYPSQEKFLRTWLNRLDSFLNLYVPNTTGNTPKPPVPIKETTFEPNWRNIIILVLLALIALLWFLYKKKIL